MNLRQDIQYHHIYPTAKLPQKKLLIYVYVHRIQNGSV